MSFVRVNPSGWITNGELQSSEINQLDIDHANAVDKTGDTITGVIAVANGARINFASGAKCTILSGGVYEAQSGSNTNFLSGSFLTVATGATLTCHGAISVEGGAFTADVGSTFELDCEAIFNNNATYNDFVTFTENITLDSASMILTSGSGIGVQGGATISWANTANASFQSGANANFASGASLNIASGAALSLSGTETVNSGGVITVASGGTISVASGGNLSVTGTETIASGGTLVLASGATASFAMGSSTTFSGGVAFAGSSVVSFVTSPTFSNGLLVSSGPAQFNGIVNLLGATTIVGVSNRLGLSTRSVTRLICLANAKVDPSLFGYSYNIVTDHIAVGAGGFAAVDLHPPHNSIIKEVKVTWSGTGNVTIRVRENSSSLDDLTTSSSGTHTLTLNNTAQRDGAHYRLTFKENASNAPVLEKVEITCDVNEYDEG